MQVYKREYDPTNAASIFKFSSGLLNRSLAEAVTVIDPNINPEDIAKKGKGGLGQLVEKFWYGYEPNSAPTADFEEAGVELKTTPLKMLANKEYAIKERLVCDMINYMEIVNLQFEESPFYKKSLLMLVLFYLHASGKQYRDLEFIFSVLWKLQGKDLMIMRHDYEIIVNKIKQGKAHELSEGDTMYLAACHKSSSSETRTKQPFSDIEAAPRAFSLKQSYMRTILDFVRNSGSNMATNTEVPVEKMQLVSEKELQAKSFEEILTERLMKFKGKDCMQIGKALSVQINPNNKSKLALATKHILLKNLNRFEDAEEIKKAGIIAKTVRVETNGTIIEDMSFENINYDEILENEEWLKSRWHEIVTSRFMFVVYQADGTKDSAGKKRYALDKVIFWTMPTDILPMAEEYWKNIRNNVIADTLQDNTNTFWRKADRKLFHVRPKSQTSHEKYISPVSGIDVPKKCYWFNRDYVAQIIKY